MTRSGDAADVPERLTARDVIRAGAPWFGIRVAPTVHRFVSSFGGSDDGVSLGLGHRWGDSFVEVYTETRPARDAQTEDWSAVHRVLGQAFDFDDVLPTNFPLRVKVDRREVDLPVDGVPTTFVVIDTARQWLARAQVGERTIRIQGAGRSIDDLEVITVDPERDYEIPDAPDPSPDKR